MTASPKLLRIYTDERAFIGDRQLFEFVSSRAREERLAGATVLEAVIGFGRSAHLHQRHILESDRALVIEIVDTETRLRAFVEALGDLSGIGLITLEAVEVLGGKTGLAIDSGTRRANGKPQDKD